MPSTSFQAPFLVDDYLRSVGDWQKAVTESMLHAQRVQWGMLAAWQRAIGAVQEDLRDQWVCRFGGGVPLDG
ncbi:hypothetical protein [Variovorax sp. EBFNA2]|uniref:hypothetical protein n=1 Tax=Variovorax sp. EBFNA2 TaxID=3342097 RepID=UPI0029BFBE73|nr:hypothetical protein [Variovorax boronicumulans]WPG40888.1 hypothetical protein RZE79_32830 [Variovorax boronicumulans]